MGDSAKILPKEGQRNVLITSALPYVNSTPHLGNLIGSVLSADVFSRYCKIRGWNTLYVCGTDEYGTATETKAIEEGMTPEALCAKFNAIHQDIYKWFRINFDIFGRTPTAAHTEICQSIFLDLQKNGYLEERTTTQPYCEKHQSFLADRFVEGTCPAPDCLYPDARGDQCDKCGRLLDPLELINPRCKLDGATPVPRETKHIFLLLDKLQPQVEEWVRNSIKVGAWSANGASITEKWLTEGLKPRGITRDLKWGVPVPLEGYENKVLYVWFDACIGYPSITANYTSEWKKWWKKEETDKYDVKLYQFLGKDNVPFHSIIFPSCQLGTGEKWTQLHHLSTTEYLQYEGGKFSKSRGIGVFGNNAQDTKIDPDVWRFYLLSNRPQTGDSEFEWTKFIDANNNELLKNLGNFVNRVIKFVNSKIYNSVVPEYTLSDPYFKEHIEGVNVALERYNEQLTGTNLRGALMTAIHISSLGNKLLQDNKLDNKLATEQPELCGQVVGTALNHIHILASLIEPYMPGTFEAINKQLNTKGLTIPDKWSSSDWVIKGGHKIGQAAYLFTQIPASKEQEWRELFGGDEARKAKEEIAAKKAKKAAEKAKKKEKKATKKEGESVEAIEKGGKDALPSDKTAVEEVTEGVKQAVIQSS